MTERTTPDAGQRAGEKPAATEVPPAIATPPSAPAKPDVPTPTEADEVR